MKRFILVLLLLLIALITFNIIVNPQQFFHSIIITLELWLYKVYPAIFTFYIIAALLINTNIINRVIYILRFLFKKIRFVDERLTQFFFLSIFTGAPAIIDLIGNSINNKSIIKENANELLKCTSFLNPIFILSFFSTYNIKYAFILIFVHTISNFLIALFENKNNEQTIISKSNTVFLIDDLFSSINNVVSLLLVISAMMVIANIIYFSITNVIQLFYGKTPLFLNILFMNIEISIGLKELFSLNFNHNPTLLICAFITGFGGFSIHLQSYILIKKYNLNYNIFFKYRLYQAVLSTLIIIPFLML